jgi:S1-C subfamily serine protease
MSMIIFLMSTILIVHITEILSSTSLVYGIKISESVGNLSKVSDSVVQVVSKIPTLLLGRPITNSSELSSGFVYDTDGHIVSTYHGVAGAKVVYVMFPDGKWFSAIVEGSDAYSDISVLKIIGDLPHGILPLQIGNSSDLSIGEQVTAFGHPKLEGQGPSNSITSGIISNTRFLLQDPKLAILIPDVIQTDAIINPGESGGPILNAQGQVIGITYGRIFPTVFSPGNQYPGLTLAIPSNLLTRVVPQLIDRGSYIHPFLGLSGCTLTPDMAKQLGLFGGNLNGILVNSVAKNGPADKAGINGSSLDKYSTTHLGDIITAVDGFAVAGIEDLISYVEKNKSVKDHIELQLFRNGQVLQKDAILEGLTSPVKYLQALPSCPALN